MGDEGNGMAQADDVRWAIVAVDASAGTARTLATFDSHREALARWLGLVDEPDRPADQLSLEPLGDVRVDAVDPEVWSAAIGEPVRA